MNLEEYKKMMNKLSDTLSGLYFDNKIKTDNYSIFYSSIISDNFWNIAILNKEESLGNESTLKEIEQNFKQIDRQPCIYIPLLMRNYDSHKQLLISNGYRLDDTHACMFYESQICSLNVTNKIIKVEDENQYVDYMKVTASAFGGEISEENPYAGSVTDEYYQAIKASLGNNNINHYVLYQDNEPVCAATLSTTNKYGSINNVGTKKDYQNKGFGKQMISYIINGFNKSGGKELTLATEYNSKNERWYQGQGFKTKFIVEQYVKD